VTSFGYVIRAGIEGRERLRIGSDVLDIAFSGS